MLLRHWLTVEFLILTWDAISIWLWIKNGWCKWFVNQLLQMTVGRETSLS